MEHKREKQQIDLKTAMPKTAEWVARQRQAFGNAWVTEQIRQGMAGKPGHFYAIEGGHVLGTPLPTMDDMQQLAVVTGCPFAGFIATPKGPAHGAH